MPTLYGSPNGAPAVLDLVIVQGVDFAFGVEVRTGGSASGPLLNLTGYSAAMECSRRGNTLFRLTGGAGLTLGGAAGTITAAIAGADTADFPAGEYDYDWNYTDGAGVVSQALRGKLTVLPGYAGVS